MQGWPTGWHTDDRPARNATAGDERRRRRRNLRTIVVFGNDGCQAGGGPVRSVAHTTRTCIAAGLGSETIEPGAHAPRDVCE